MMLKAKVILVSLLSFSFYSFAFSKCAHNDLKENFQESSIVVWGEVIGSNYNPGILKRTFRPANLNHKTHKFQFQVGKVFKGVIEGEVLSFEYDFSPNIKETQRLFQAKEKLVLFVKSLNNNKASLLRTRCDGWGIEVNSIKEATQLLISN